MAAAKKARESSAKAGSFAMSVTDPKVHKSSPAGDAGVSDLLMTNFLSSPFTCFKLADHIHKANDLDTFQVFPWRNKGKRQFICFKKSVVLVVETIRNLFTIASSSA